MDRDPFNLIITGVGGQGIILASEILCDVLLLNGHDVKKSEIHGMSQRGGSVISHIRFGEKVYSPILTRNQADFIISFELLETLRYINYANKKTRIITGTQKIYPLPVLCGLTSYPENIEEKLKSITSQCYFIDTVQTAGNLGSLRVINIIILGFLSRFLNINKQDFINVIKDRVPAKMKKINIQAFEEGWKLGEDKI